MKCLIGKVSFAAVRVYHCNLLLFIKRRRLKGILLQFLIIQIGESLINQIFKLLFFINKNRFIIFHNLWLLLNFESITLNSVILIWSLIICFCWEISQSWLCLPIFSIFNHILFLILILFYTERLVIICNFTQWILLGIYLHFLIKYLPKWGRLLISRHNVFNWILNSNGMWITLMSLQLLLQLIEDDLQLFFIQIVVEFRFTFIKIVNFILLVVWAESDLTDVTIFLFAFVAIVFIEVFMVKHF